MTQTVSAFSQALTYQQSISIETTRRIHKAFNAMQGSAVDIPQGNIARPSRSTSAPSQTTRSTPARKQNVQSPTPASRNAPVRSSHDQEIRRRREIETAERQTYETKRNRKAIANTQADKRGRESGNMTTLATSGIDGKGLKINRIR